MQRILSQAAANLRAQARLRALQQDIGATSAASVHAQPAHRPALALVATMPTGHITESMLAACISEVPLHSVTTWSPFTESSSLRPLTMPSSPTLPPSSILPRLPPLNALLARSESQDESLPATATQTPDTTVRARKTKYRTRFSLAEEEALIKFWFKFRFKYSIKSKIFWRMAERNGICDRDAISVQKHFDHILKHGRMRDLFRVFRCKGRLTDVIDSIDIENDFNVLPLTSQDVRTSESVSESDSEAVNGLTVH